MFHFHKKKKIFFFFGGQFSYLEAKLIKHGIITAGDTAANTNPNINPTVQGSPSMTTENTATARASVKHGINVALTTIPLSFIKATGSSSNPAINKMTVKQINLKVREIEGSRSCPI